ncbi:unnamed protein product [Urochloa humidicola]
MPSSTLGACAAACNREPPACATAAGAASSPALLKKPAACVGLLLRRLVVRRATTPSDRVARRAAPTIPWGPGRGRRHPGHAARKVNRGREILAALPATPAKEEEPLAAPLARSSEMRASTPHMTRCAGSPVVAPPGHHAGLPAEQPSASLGRCAGPPADHPPVRHAARLLHGAAALPRPSHRASAEGEGDPWPRRSLHRLQISRGKKRDEDR